ncbi:transcriptional regulator, AsnC family [Modicisalibacter ilicicola DSM 19980]|uniref:siroheme decarboxylase n=1 Tax=Modicisalibacter ilicicola DSM 19980 TaxID=1121942 RepID=A0A1M4SFV7_9GAMM|nr:AsnC family protein [Halomonas ilicicola]SHE31071.1 transcriptional regulator, AsnC family [Halomonas ilicicola DSM 19980]
MTSTTLAMQGNRQPVAELPSTRGDVQRLRALLERGLPLTSRPWQTLAEQCGMSEAEVLALVEHWQADGLIKRLGLVVKHRPLGIRANAMVVWDVPDDQVAALGRRLAAESAVTLCYRRPRRLPEWPYNLFCMIHGTRRPRVLSELDAIVARQGLEQVPHRVLFSTRAYRQHGARYLGE